MWGRTTSHGKLQLNSRVQTSQLLTSLTVLVYSIVDMACQFLETGTITGTGESRDAQQSGPAIDVWTKTIVSSP
ncbi:hypothetical protein BCR37DRAFT_378726 [Protomyces lactucae-debilis]|uniref:Uncharacterized protein n=1 Tax=Protomyces lactucae-debilis TaxID=2754530 RepID=A0A1Y2FII3_PROLT|nr:uncharacterized protein BCR37DRAFT_378726 [Protomyces lactucae-debilis]ORY83751.1 hypothetical protein BCR37DRAFT_378726 [Protomyces lactucae-debilis]